VDGFDTGVCLLDRAQGLVQFGRDQGYRREDLVRLIERLS
jgi:uncharacterized protein YcaQ